VVQQAPRLSRRNMPTFNYTFGGATNQMKDSTWKFVDLPAEQGTDEWERAKYEKAEKVASFVAAFWLEHRYGPTFREIQEATQIPSLSTVKEMVDILSRMDLLTYVPKQARTIVPTDKLLNK